jgi:Glycosyl transferase family 90
MENDDNTPSQTLKCATTTSLKFVVIFLTLIQYIRSLYQSQSMKSNLKVQLKTDALNHSVILESANFLTDTSHTYDIPSYSIDSIANLINQLVYIPGLILIYDPVKDRIHVYSIAPPSLQVRKYCFRCDTHIPIIVQALWQFSHLSPRSKPVQIFLSESDFPYVNMEHFEATKNQLSYANEGNATISVFSPWLQFGSVPRNSTWFPNVYVFPFLNFLKCLTEWNAFHMNHGNNSLQSPSDTICNSWELPLRDLPWESLSPTLFWRGQDYAFLHTLSSNHFENLYRVPEIPFFPRRLLTELSKNYSWINVAWSHNSAWISPIEHALYRYQIDVGGAGGTSWTGTINKLAMPGLLFHHETPSKDWFYDDLKAWEHYIPILTDLSDLDSKYKWAEENQGKAKEIAENATKFVRKLFSYSNLQTTYEKYFGHNGLLYNISHAYNAHNITSLEAILTTFTARWNFELNEVVICSRQFCDIKHRPRIFVRIFMDGKFNAKSIRKPHRFGMF